MADPSPMGRPRRGVLGGSFDPPHLGHLIVASEACELLGLDGVLFVPAADPPHKEDRDETPFVLRLAMTGLATADDRRFSVSAVEAEQGLRYTADTVAALAALDPGREQVFVMGSDSLLQLHTWWRPEEILAAAHLAVVPRPGDSPAEIAAAVRRWGTGRVTVLDTPPIGISSTLVRERAAAGRTVRYLVPGAVAGFIDEHRMYRRP